MEQAVEKIYRNSEVDSVEFGRYKEHKVTHYFDIEDCTFNRIHIWEYIHYGVLCCRVEFVNGRNMIKILIGSGCWSTTDSNNINGFLCCLEVPRVRVYNHYNNIRLKIDGNKTTYTQIIIEGEYGYY